MPRVNKDIDLEWEDIESVIEELDDEEQSDVMSLIVDAYIGDEPFHPGHQRAASEIGSEEMRLRFVVDLLKEWDDRALRQAIVERLMTEQPQ